MNPLKKLDKANDDYHEAVDEIFTDENIPVTAKTLFGTMVHRVFQNMKDARKIIASYYEE